MWNRNPLIFGAGVLLAAACGGANPGTTVAPATSPEAAMALLGALADDSLEGRATGRPGATKAARIIAAEMARIGLTDAGDSGFFQRVPVVIGTRRLEDREITGPMLAGSLAARDSFPASKRLPAVNVIGVIEGGDRSLASEHIVVSAHYDHIGIRASASGDSINNGADDDASGVVAVLKVAEQLARGAKPRRTVYFAAWIGEESGGLGARWYSDNPARPIGEMVANLQIEMIGRPDTAAGGIGRAWLTGYERSTMGEILAAGGVPIGPDRRPAQNFFRRSDNYRFATLGVVAHTLSSYNMHADYHRPSDEIGKVDAIHLARVIDATTQAVRLLANGPKPEWKPGGRPSRSRP